MNSKRQRDDDSDSEDADGCGYERQHLKVYMDRTLETMDTFNDALEIANMVQRPSFSWRRTKAFVAESCASPFAHTTAISIRY
jgi:hypothetical protein